jgi:DNA polymerase III sliding clamp (beta) subunit (PCNA family)
MEGNTLLSAVDIEEPAIRIFRLPDFDQVARFQFSSTDHLGVPLAANPYDWSYTHDLALWNGSPVAGWVDQAGWINVHSILDDSLEWSWKLPQTQQVIVPRKGILELQRILAGDEEVELKIGTNHIRATVGSVRFTSKLIDGKFPEYGRVIPAAPNRIVTANRDLLRQSLQRTAILSNEKYRGVRLSLSPGQLIVQAHNPEQEEAEDQIEVDYSGEALEIGFNVTYLLDALAAVETENVEIGLTDSNSSCLIRAPGATAVRYVVMPMRL